MYAVKVALSSTIPDDNWFLMNGAAIPKLIHGARSAAPKFGNVNQIISGLHKIF